MKLSKTEEDAVRKLCLRAIEAAKEHGQPGQCYLLPLVIPGLSGPYERAVELRVSAAPEDFS